MHSYRTFTYNSIPNTFFSKNRKYTWFFFNFIFFIDIILQIHKHDIYMRDFVNKYRLLK